MNPDDESAIVTPKTVDAYTPFFAILKRIHIRLIAEGYVMKDGQLQKGERLLGIEEDMQQEKSRSSRKS